MCYRSMTRSFAAMKRVRKLFQRALHGCVARPQTKLDVDETTEVELEWDTAFTLSATARPAVQETSFAHIHDSHEATQPPVSGVLVRTVDAAAQASLAATTQAAAAAQPIAAQHAAAAVLAAPLKQLEMSGALVYPAWQNLKGAAKDHGRACTEYHVQLRA
jgi:hypothetical protein